VAGSLRRRRCGAAGSRIHGAQQGVVVAPPTCLGHHSQQQQQGPSGPILDLATAAPQTRPSVPERQRRGRFLVGPGTPRDVARAARPARSGGSPPAASIIRMHAPTGPPVMPMRRYANRVTTSGGECRRSGTCQRWSSRSWAAASKLRRHINPVRRAHTRTPAPQPPPRRAPKPGRPWSRCASIWAECIIWRRADPHVRSRTGETFGVWSSGVPGAADGSGCCCPWCRRPGAVT
jgi:hypothetical protein